MSKAKDHLSDISKGVALFELCASFDELVLVRGMEGMPDTPQKRKLLRRKEKLTRWVSECRRTMPEAAHIPSVNRFAKKHAKESLETMMKYTSKYGDNETLPTAAWLYALTTLLADLRCMWPHAKKAAWRRMTATLEGWQNVTTDTSRKEEVELVGMRIYWRLADTFRFSNVRLYAAGTYDDFAKSCDKKEKNLQQLGIAS